MQIHKPFLTAVALLCSPAAFAQSVMTTPTPLPSATTAMPTEEKKVEQHMMKMDIDKNGFISRHEADPEMRAHWKQWDLNEDGKIDAGEYSSAAKAAPQNEKKAR